MVPAKPAQAGFAEERRPEVARELVEQVQAALRPQAKWHPGWVRPGVQYRPAYAIGRDRPAVEPEQDREPVPGLVRCRRLVEQASVRDLETARPRARRLAIELPLLGRAAGLTSRRDLGGLLLLISGFVTPEMALALALFFADTEIGTLLDQPLPAPPLRQP